MKLTRLRQRIERLRKKMIALALEKGLTDSEVVGLSQRLDSILNEYNSIKGGTTNA